MYAKRKLLLGILSAVIFVCAAVLLILPLRTSVVRAQMTQDPGKYTSLAIKTQDISLEAGMQAEDLKEHITVTANYNGGSDELSPDDYTLSLQEGGLLTAGQPNTLVATINDGTATGSVSLPEVSANANNVVTRIVLNGSSVIFSPYSNADVWRALSGTVYMSNGNDYPLSNYKNNVGWQVNYIGFNDLFPDSAAETQQGTYTRAVTVSCVNSEGVTVTSAEYGITVTWVEPAVLTATPKDNLGMLYAGQPINPDDFTLRVRYDIELLGTSLFRTLNVDDYGIVYQNGGDTIQFGDTYVTFTYKEGSAEQLIRQFNFELYNITISEEFIPAPSIASSLPDYLSRKYAGEDIVWTFNDYNENTSTVNVALAETDVEYVVTFSKRNAGTYTITFMAEEGYRYQEVPSGVSKVYYKNDDGETIIGLEYTLTITKAEIVSADFVLPEISWDYTGSVGEYKPVAPETAQGVGSDDPLNLSTAGEGGAVTFTWKYRNISSGEVTEDMPTDAGEYEVWLVISGFANYEDYTTTKKTFTINSAEVALPTLNATSFEYTGETIYPTVTPEQSSLYDTKNGGGLNVGEYSVTFTLNDSSNYHWAAGEGVKGAEYTIKWSIKQAENELTVTVENWTYNDGNKTFHNSPEWDATFKNEGVAPEYTFYYKAWGGENYTPITDLSGYEWHSGYYKVVAKLDADNSGHGNFSASHDEYEFVVYRMYVSVPALSQSEFTYGDGTVNIADYIENYSANSGRYTLGGDMSCTDAGAYKVALTLGADYQWGNGTADNSEKDDDISVVTLSWQINRKVVPAPELEGGGITVYAPKANEIHIDNFNSSYFTVSGDSRLTFSGNEVTVTNQTETLAIAGRYEIILTLDSNYCVNSTDAAMFGKTLTVELTWVIQRLGVERPTAVQQETYTGDVLEYRLAKDFIAYSAKTGGGKSINAGYYNVTFTLNPNYCWDASGSGDTADHTLADGFTILRQEIDKPTIEASSLETVYNAEAQTVTAAGYDAVTMEYAATAQEKGDEISSEDGVTFTATNAGTYNITFRLTNTKNYTWKGGDTAPNGPAAGTVEFTWVINKADIKVTGEDEYNGWAYGVTPTDPDRLNIVPVLAGNDKEVQNPEITYTYKDSGGSVLKDGISKTSPAGSYTLVVSVAEGENTLANTKEYTFTITKNTAVISDATLAGGTENISWTYGDEPGKLSYTVTVGDTNITDIATYEYFTRGWEESGDWKELGSKVGLTKTSDAGYYKVVITIAEDKNNYLGKEVTIEFTINKQTVEVPVLTGGDGVGQYGNRYFTYNGSSQRPGVEVELEEGLYSVIYPEESTTYNEYYVKIVLAQPNNYEWSEDGLVNLPGVAQDVINGATVSMWYLITKTTYTVTLNMVGWTFGDYNAGENSPAPDFSEAESQLTESDYRDVTSAEVRYWYYGADYKGHETAETATNVRPTQVGTYTVFAVISGTTNCEEMRPSTTFTVSPAALQAPAEGYKAEYDAHTHFAVSEMNVTAKTDDGNSNSSESVKDHEDCTIEFLVNENWTTAMPQVRNVADSATIRYRISYPNHKMFEGSITVSITAFTIGAENIEWTNEGSADTAYTYNGSNQNNIAASATGLTDESGEFETFEELIVSLDEGKTEFKDAGNYTFTAKLPEDALAGNYTLEDVAGGATMDYVMKRLAVEIKADDSEMIYGDQPSGLGRSYIGDGRFVESDGIVILLGTTAISTSPITANGHSYRTYIAGIGDNDRLSNYTINGVQGEEFEGYASVANATYDGVMTVTARPVSVDFTDVPETYNGSKQYVSATAEAVEGKPSSGAVSDETIIFVYSYSWTSIGNETSSVDHVLNRGTYVVTVKLPENSNYVIEGAKTRKFVVAAYDATNDVKWSEGITFTYDGADQSAAARNLATFNGIGDDAAEGKYTLITTTTGTFRNAGGYTFTASFADGNNEYGNYVISAKEEYTIAQRTVYITLDSDTVTYGNELPALSWKYSGESAANELLRFVDGISQGDAIYDIIASGLDTELRDGVTCVISPKGEYTVTVSGGATGALADVIGNYNVQITSGKLKVEKRAITVTIDPADSTYGEERDLLSANVTAGSLYDNDMPYELSAEIDKTTAAGSYPITLENVMDKKYAITVANEQDTLYTVNKATIKDVSVTPAPGLVYANADLFGKAFTKSAITVNDMKQTWTYSFAKDGEYKSALTLKDADEYTVYYKITAKNHEEYSGSFTVTIGKAEVTISATAGVTYGDPVPVLGDYDFIYTTDVKNFNAENEDIKPGVTFTVATDYEQGDTAAKDYTITLSGEKEVKNFIITYSKGTLSVAKKAVRLYVENHQITYGNQEALTLQLAAGSELVAGTIIEDFLKYLDVTDADGRKVTVLQGYVLPEDQAAGEYHITGRNEDGNYDITYTYTTNYGYSTYTIAPAAVTVTPGGTSGSYNGDPFTFNPTADVDGLNFTVTYYKNNGTTTDPDYGEEDKLTEAPTDAGRYVAVITANDKNYTVTNTAVPFEIYRLVFSVEGIGFNDKYTATYSGQPYSPVLNGDTKWTGIDGTKLVVTYDEGITNVTGDSGVRFMAHFSLSDYTNYYLTTTSAETIVVITPKEVDIEWRGEAEELVYRGEPLLGYVSAWYKGVDGSEHKLAITADGDFIDAGSYIFTAKFDTNDDFSSNYALPADVTNEFVISPAQVTVEIVQSGKTYDGVIVTSYNGVKNSNYRVTEGEVYGEDDLDITIFIAGGAAQNANSYDVTADWNNSNYTVKFTETSFKGAYVISPAEIADAEVSYEIYGGEQGATYDGVEHTAASGMNVTTATIADGQLGNTAEWTFSLDGVNYYSVSDSAVMLRNVKRGADGGVESYTVYFKITADNHKVYESSFEVTINPAEVSAEWTEKVFTYNGADQRGNVTAVYTAQHDGGQKVNLITYCSEEFKDVNGGKEYTFTASFDPEDELHGNYVLAEASAEETYTMQKAALEWRQEFAWADKDNDDYAWIFDTQEDIFATRTSPSAMLANNNGYVIEEGEGENGTITVEYFRDKDCKVPFEGAFDAQTDAGTYYARVTVKATGNYGYGEDFGDLAKVYSFTVEQKAITVNWRTQSFDFTGDTNTNTLTFNSEIMEVSDEIGAGYYISVDGGVVTMTASAVGTYGVTLTLTNNNYKWQAAENERALDVTWSISNASNSWEIELTITEWTYGKYDEAVNAPHAQALYGTVVYYYSVNGANEPTDLTGLTSAVPVNAGTYWVVAYVEATADYMGLFAAEQFTISKAQIDVPAASAKTYEYTGDSQTYLPDGFSADKMYISGNVQTGAGSYTVTVTLRDTRNYEWTGGTTDSKKYTFIIGRQKVTAPSVPDGQWTYDGSAKDVTLENFSSTTMGVHSMEGLSLEVAGVTGVRFVTADAGNYEIVISLKDTENYEWADGTDGFVTLSWRIDRAENSWKTEPYIAGWTYGNTPSRPSGAAAFGRVTYTYYTEEGQPVTPSVYTSAGKYYVIASVAGNGNYGGLEFRMDFTVAKAEYDFSGVTWTEQAEYTGKELRPEATGLPVGLDGSAVSYTVKGATDAGEYSLSVTFTTTSGNYFIPEQDYTVQFEILPRTVTAQWQSGELTYNGKDRRGEVKAFYTDVNGNHQPLDVGLTGDDFTDVNEAGYTFTATMPDGVKNYVLAGAAEEVFYILPADITVNILDYTVTYTGEDFAEKHGTYNYEVTGGGYVEGDNLDITLSILADEAINVGSYAIGGSSANANYNVTFIQGVFSIQHARLGVKVNAGGGEYLGTIAEATAEFTDPDGAPAGVGGFVITYSGAANDGTPVSGTAVPELPGTYVVTVSFENANYIAEGGVATMIISRATVSLPEIRSVQYSGHNMTADIADGELYTVTRNEGGLNVGSYPVELKLRDSYNYRWSNSSGDTAVVYFTITIADNSITAPEINATYVYGEAIAPWGAQAKFGSPDDIYYLFSESENGSFTPTVPVNAGIYYVRAAIAATSNYYGATSVQAVKFEILPRQIGAPELQNGSTVYTGGEQSNMLYGYDRTYMSVSTGSLSIMQTEDGNLRLSATNAGRYEITFTLTDSRNFIWEEDFSGSVVWQILRADYDLGGISFEDTTYTYDGTAKSVFVKGVLPEGLSVEYTGNGMINAGTYSVTATFAGDYDNYNEIAPITVRLVIEKADYDLSGITFADTTFAYDGTEKSVLVQGTLPAGLKVEYSGNGMVTVGTYSVTATFIGDYDNYNEVAPMTARLVIEKGNYDLSGITFKDTTYTYDGTEKSVLVQGTLPAGLTVVYSGNGRINAGTYSVTATFAGDYDNYNEVAPVTVRLVIEKADYDLSGISFEDTTYTYDGTAKTLVIKGTLPEGVNVTYTPNTITNAGSLKVTATVAGDSNHNDAVLTALLTIEKATPDYILPENLTAMGGQMLSSIELPAGWQWQNGMQTVGDEGENKFTAIFTPADTANYNIVVMELTVSVTGLGLSDSAILWIVLACIAFVALVIGWMAVSLARKSRRNNNNYRRR